MAGSKKDTNRDRPKDGDKDVIGTAGGALAGGAVGGVAGGAMAGAAAGGLAGPAGAAIGAAVGAVAGALAGKAIADRIDPDAEDRYWRSNYATRPYVTDRASYDEYAPAYRMGYERYPEYHGRTFEEVEPEFERDWETRRGDSGLSWSEARAATRDAFLRARDTIERMTPGDADRDGK